MVLGYDHQLLSKNPDQTFVFQPIFDNFFGTLTQTSHQSFAQSGSKVIPPLFHFINYPNSEQCGNGRGVGMTIDQPTFQLRTSYHIATKYANYQQKISVRKLEHDLGR